jgi:hypothetical protein
MPVPARARNLSWLSLATAFAGIVITAGCGAQPVNSSPNSAFINGTQHSDAELAALWKSAQQTLSVQVDLNPLQRELYNAPPDVLPGDARVWNISPHQLQVSAKPDVSSPALEAATGMVRPDPTGLIACPQPCNVQYAPAYSLYAQPATTYAKSWELSESNFDGLVKYEFENQILHALGYDLRWR